LGINSFPISWIFAKKQKRYYRENNSKIKMKISEYTHFAIDFGDLGRNLLFAPDDVYLCAGPGCALCVLFFGTLITLPFLPFTLAHTMLPVLPIIKPRMIYICNISNNI
jgi:hypothetical protein